MNLYKNVQKRMVGKLCKKLGRPWSSNLRKPRLGLQLQEIFTLETVTLVAAGWPQSMVRLTT